LSLVVRQARLEELPGLSELCLRSKAVWGYDQAFLEACRSELTLLPEELRTTLVAVAEKRIMANDAPVGFALPNPGGWR
jgi:hypothetical protein